MVKFLHRSGWRVVANLADTTSALSGSAGVLIISRSHLQLSNLARLHEEWTDASCSRYIFGTLRLRGVDVTIVSVYLHACIGLTGLNLSLLSELGVLISRAGAPVIVAGDWNMRPELLGDSGFLAKAGLAVVPMPNVAATCVGAGTPSLIDFCCVSNIFMDAIEFDGIDPSAPWGTH
eukprot:3838361-Pyramimonas_sp.AAC.1